LRLALGRGAADELLLASQRVLPKKLTGAGYVHAYVDLPDALTAALAPRRPLRP
jgi:NAD dependent epimerase/dehydratase family enzyme